MEQHPLEYPKSAVLIDTQRGDLYRTMHNQRLPFRVRYQALKQHTELTSKLNPKIWKPFILQQPDETNT